jgi:hypothetical protein
MEHATSKATVIATESCQMMSVDRLDYEKVLLMLGRKAEQLKIDFFR